MVNALVSPLFWSLFFLTTVVLLSLKKLDLTSYYVGWLKLPLKQPRLVLSFHLVFVLSCGFLGYRGLGVLGLTFLPLAFYAGKVFLSLRFEEELKAYSAFLPELLELITLCLRAGLSLEFTLSRLMPLINKRSPFWADAIKEMLAEIKLGLPLNTAFRNLAVLIPLPVITRIANMVGHAQSYGTQLAPLFQQMAKDIRVEQLAILETKAQKLPVYLSIVLVVFFLPCLLLVTLAPLMIRLVESLSLAFT